MTPTDEPVSAMGAASVDAPEIPAISVLMPTHGQAAFIRRAVDSLLAQSLTDWELIVVDDASPDESVELIAPSLADPRVRLVRLEANGGLGAALNRGLEEARAPLVGYLPSDDVLHADHLASLVRCLAARPDAVLAYSGVRHHYNRIAEGVIEGEPLQLVQVAHRAGAERWLERSELVTDDLERMFWSRLRPRGPFVGTGSVTCEWVSHPDQRHLLLREPVGGVHRYRTRYAIAEPLRFHTTVGNPIDEVERYRHFRERPDTPRAADGLEIVLAGELAYNPERVLALEERGHRLLGLWMDEPQSLNTVGPLPFGHVEDLPRDGWQDVLRRRRPDVIYALLNWQAVPFAHRVLRENPGVPFVWHFKEGPFICLEKGTWRELLELTERSDGLVLSSPEMAHWFETVAPGSTDPERCLILDGDLPKRDWLTAERSPRIEARGDEVHTVVPGRPIGLHAHNVAELAGQGIHLHFYGDFTHGLWRAWIEKCRTLAPGFLHLHGNVDQEGWTAEFSQYDAGWLHVFRSENGGDVRNANWDDLNYPARIATLAAAGLPMLQLDNEGAIVATQSLAREGDFGIFFREFGELGGLLRDRELLGRVRDNVWARRDEFTFDHHADRLIAFFRQVIERAPARA